MKTGELIKKYRKMRRMTQRQLAAACGQTDSAIRNYELCNRTPGERPISSLAHASTKPRLFVRTSSPHAEEGITTHPTEGNTCA
uniref:helix-turn-helix domain-containing protein n=1 Tax=Curtanaerobium respiraculi TaxID=2949669 RepID=UPI0024B38911|nr:helix-turn-helix transcriptional regulator [Curtanaerobium respiraculi]